MYVVLLARSWSPLPVAFAPADEGLLTVPGPNGLLNKVVGPNDLLKDVVVTFPCFERWVGGCRKSGGDVLCIPDLELFWHAYQCTIFRRGRACKVGNVRE